MLKYEDLRMTPSPGEIVYSWQAEPGSPIRLWATGRMEKWLETAGLEVHVTHVDKMRAEQYYRDRGIETPRLQALLDNHEALLRPIIFMKMDGEDTHLLLDGHHRYVMHASLDLPMIRLYILTEEQARQFEVEGHPAPLGAIIDPSRPSGLPTC